MADRLKAMQEQKKDLEAQAKALGAEIDALDLCFMSWEQIAVDLGYNVRHLYRFHEEALEKVVVP